MVEKQYQYKRSKECQICHMNSPMDFISCKPNDKPCEASKKFDVETEDDAE